MAFSFLFETDKGGTVTPIGDGRGDERTIV